METEQRERITIRRCPHCDGLIKIFLECGLRKGDEGDAFDWKVGLAAEQIQVVERARKVGVLAAFESVVNESQKGKVPKSIEKFFLTFMNMAVPRRIPQFCMDKLNDAFGGERISVYGAQGIALILAGNEIRWFVPYDLVRGVPLSKIGGTGTTKRASIDEDAFVEWIRTKHGYVAGRGVMLDSMRAKSRGAFARLVQ